MCIRDSIIIIIIIIIIITKREKKERKKESTRISPRTVDFRERKKRFTAFHSISFFL